MKFPKRWLKDVVVVRFEDNGYKGDLILPPGIKHATKLCVATVVAVGSKWRYKDAIKVGSQVYVDSHMGTRRTYEDQGELVTYDWDDVYGVIV